MAAFDVVEQGHVSRSARRATVLLLQQRMRSTGASLSDVDHLGPLLLLASVVGCLETVN